MGFLGKYVVGLLVFMSSVSNAKVYCDTGEYLFAFMQLEFAVKKSKTSENPWADLQEAFFFWESCIHRFQDELFVDAIANLTRDRWEEVPKLRGVKTRKASFYKYIIDSLSSEIVSTNQSEPILAHIKKECPKGAKDICKDIEMALEASSGESKPAKRP